MMADRLRLLVVLAVLLPACARDPSLNPIRIGVISMLSGAGAQPSSRDLGRAARLAAEEVNAAGGLRVGGEARNVLVLEEDDRSSPDAAVEAARRLINAGVVALVGPQFSSNAIPVARLADRLGVPMVCPLSTHPDTTAGLRWVVRGPYLDTFQGEVLARFARETLGAARVALLYDASAAYNSTLAEVFGDTFRALGGAVVARETYSGDMNTDFRSQLQRAAEVSPDLLFLPNYAQDTLLQARQAREVGLEAALLGGDGWDGRAFAAEPVFEGAHYTTIWDADVEDPGSRAFVASFRAAYGEQPTGVAAASYDAMGLVLAAIRGSGSVAPEAIRDRLAATRGHPGVTGTITYGGGQDPVKSAIIIRIRDGDTELAGVVQPSEPPP